MGAGLRTRSKAIEKPPDPKACGPEIYLTTGQFKSQPMKNKMNKTNHGTRWMRRIARIWSFPIIVYTLLMFTGLAWNLVTIGRADPYAVEGYPIIEAIPPVLMFFSVIGLGIAWRWERWGGMAALFFQLATLFVLIIQRPTTGDTTRSFIPFLISIVIAIPGILFWVSWSKSRRISRSHTDV